MVPSLVTPAVGTAREGVDRCPGARAVHRAADGGLARIRVPGGALSRAAFRALGRWSVELGNGRMELTGRGNLQLRGLAPGAEHELAARLAGQGLLPAPAHERVRNVLVSPLSGRDGLGAWDVRPLLAELDRRLCATSSLAALPGRFLFAVDDGRGDVAGLGADVALLALPGRRVALLLGGRDTRLRLPGGTGVAALLASAAAFLRRRPDRRTWRVTELPGGPLSLVEDLTAALGGAARTGREMGVPAPEPYGPLGRVEQVDGRTALAVGVPLGELTPTRVRVLAEVAAREVVLTPWRGVLLPDLAPADTERAARRLAGAGLVLDPTAAVAGVTACTGRPGCAAALADVRADASVPVRAGPPVHWSGCARRCGRPPGAVVDVVAAADGYRVLRGGVLVCDGADATRARAAVTRVRGPR